MEVTVTEALRIKNQVVDKVQEIQRRFHEVQFGIIQEEDGPVIGEQKINLKAYLVAIERIFSISESINSVLSRFNVESGIADAVRHKANLNAKLDYLETAMENGSAKKTTTYEIVAQQRVAVTRTFIPFMSKAELKVMIKDLKADIRKTQTNIDNANAKKVALPFSYEDIEIVIE